MKIAACFLCSLSLASAWVSSLSTSPRVSSLSLYSSSTEGSLSRDQFIKGAVAASFASLLIPSASQAVESVSLPSGVSYEITKAGNGPKPEVGELVAIRFAAFCGELKIDDLFDNPEPYYTRVGSGGLIKGVEQVLPLMRVGDRWKLTVPGDLAFGKKGRPASAGRPRIPSDATIIFDVEMVGLPGKEEELIELIGDV